MIRFYAFLVAVVVAFLPVAASAQELIGSYKAYLSGADHYNSSGTRLKSAAAIIRQDRANYHKFGKRDDADQWDSFFDSKSNRGRMERMLKNGQAARSVHNRIVNGTPMIKVDIYGKGSRGTYIEVTVH